MKLKTIFPFWMILFFFIFGCNFSSKVGQQTPLPAGNTLSPTTVPAPSIATIPPTSVPPTPNSTIHSLLRTQGPYLVYRYLRGEQTIIRLLDADGKGQATFAYPSNAASVNMTLPLSQTLSPNGKWLAFYSGSAGTCFGEAGPNTADLTLNLMSFTDGKLHVVTRLLSKDYPAIFTKAAQLLGRADVNAQMLQNAFICGITESIDWSPDGRYLAFAGQMDGLSSDLYLYDSASNNIKRLSSGAEEVDWITWSPDGKWIVDGSSYTVGEGMQYSIFATSVDGATIKQLSKGTPQEVTSADWLNDHAYFDTNGDNGPGSYDLKLVDVNTGRTSEIWKGSYGPFTFVPYGSWVALIGNTPTWPYPYNSSDFQTGIFLVNTDSLKQTRVNSLGTWGCCTPPAFIALGHIADHLFLVRDNTNHEIQFLSSTGKLIDANIQAELVSASPDRLDWIAISNNIQIFSDDGSRLRTVALPAGMDPKGLGSITWRRDSSGFFFTYKNPQDQNSDIQLYVLELAKGNPIQIDQPSSSTADGFFWVTELGK